MGFASVEEAKLVAEMCAKHPELKAELEAIEKSIEQLHNATALTPRAELKQRVTEAIGNLPFRDEKVIPISGRAVRWTEVAAIAASVLLIVVGGIYVSMLNTELSDRNGQLAQQETQMREMELRLDSLAEANSITQNELAILKKPQMKAIELKGMEPAPDAKAMVYANTTSGEVYLELVNLPAAPEGMQYQFWGIVDGKPVDAGMIELNADTAGMHAMKPVPNAVAYAISLEKKGGSPQPEGKIYVMGTP
jgi:anti-sigma-K factor RskA